MEKSIVSKSLKPLLIITNSNMPNKTNTYQKLRPTIKNKKNNVGQIFVEREARQFKSRA